MKNKIKTNKSAAKRFRKAGANGMKFKRAKMRHRQRSKTKGVKRSLRKAGYLKDSNLDKAQKMLPYL